MIRSTAGKLAGAMRSINPAEIRLVVADEVDEIFLVRFTVWDLILYNTA